RRMSARISRPLVLSVSSEPPALKCLPPLSTTARQLASSCNAARASARASVWSVSSAWRFCGRLSLSRATASCRSTRTRSDIDASGSVRGLGAPQDVVGDAPAMDLGGAVVDAEGAHVGEDACHHGLARHPLAAENLHAAVHHAPLGFGGDHLGHAGRMAAQFALIQGPGAVPDGEA